MRRGLLIAGALILIILTVLVALPAFIDLNRYKEPLVAAAERAIHRKVEMGEIRLSLLGGPGLRLKEVSLGEKPEFGQEPSVSVGELEVRLKLLPLLSKRIEVSKLILKQPQIKLIILEDGRTNFSDLLGPRPPAKPKKEEPSPPARAPAPEKALAPAAGLLVAKLDIRGGLVTIVDHRSLPGRTLTHRLEDVEVRLRDVSLESPIRFDISAVLVRQRRQPFRLRGVVGPVGLSPDPARIPLELSVTTKDLELAYLQPYVKDLLPITIRSGSVTSDMTLTRKLPEKLAARGSIRFQEVDFTHRTTGYRPPRPLSLALDQSIEVELATDTLKAQYLRLKLGGSSLNLSGQVAQAREAPRMDLKIKSDGLALDDLALLDPTLPKRLPEALGLKGPLAFDLTFQGTLSSFSSRGSLDASKARILWQGLLDKPSGVPASAQFDFQFDGKRLSLAKANLELQGLKASAQGTITEPSNPSVDLTVSTNSFKLAGLERVFLPLKDNPLEGQVSFSGKVVGSLAEPSRSRLDGQLSLERVGPIERLLTLAPRLKASWPKDLELAGEATARLSFKGSLEAFRIEGQMDLQAGHFRYGKLLEKPRGERANLSLKASYKPKKVIINRLALALKDLEAKAKGSIENLRDPRVDLELSTNRIELSRWAPKGTTFRGKVRLALALKGKPSNLKGLEIKKAELKASGIGPLQEALKALPGLKETLPQGFQMSGFADLVLKASGTYPKLSGRLTVDLTKAGLNHPDWIVKPEGRAARLSVEGFSRDETISIKSFEATLGKDWIRGALLLKGRKKPRGSLRLASSSLDLEKLAKSLPVLKRYGLKGSIKADLRVKADSASLKQAQAQGRLVLKNLQARLPRLPAPVERISGTLELSGQDVTLRKLTLAYGGSILSLSASMRGFEAPRVSFALDSRRLVLHEWKLKPKKKALLGPPGLEEPSAPTPARAKPSKAAQNGWYPWIKKVSATGKVRIRQALYETWKLDNVQGRVSLRKGTFLLDNLTFDLHGGRFAGSALVGLDPASPSFTMRSALRGVDVNGLLSTQARLPNTVWGRLQADLQIQGRGLSPNQALPTLSGQGRLTVTEGQINMALVRDLINNMPVLKLMSLIPGFGKLRTCSRHFTSQEVTPFQSLVLPVTIRQGIAHLAPSTLVLDSKDIDVVTGAQPGYIDLIRQEIHLRNIRAVFSPELTDLCLGADAKRILADQWGRMTFPFAVDGSFRGGRMPRPRPDERFLFETIQRALAGQLFKGILGGTQKGQQPGQPSQPTQPPLPGGIEELFKIIK